MKDPEQLMLKFIQGDISPEERRELEAWIDQSSENRKMVEEFRQVWTWSSPEKLDDFQSGEEWQKLQAVLVQEQRAPIGRWMGITTYAWRAAAVLLLLLVVSGVLFLTFFNSDQILKETTENTLAITLPDGSRVWLNAHSRVQYNADFNDDRALELEGEAFFDVKRNPEKPFVIRTPEARVTVLGTSFNVKAYKADEETSVFVLTGKVSLSVRDDQQKNIVLTAGATGILNKGNERLESNVYQDPNVLAWKDKRLVFNRTPLSKVLKTLSVYFKKELRVKNEKILHCRFTSTFHDPSLEEIIETLHVALNLEVNRQQDRYVFDGEGCDDDPL